MELCTQNYFVDDQTEFIVDHLRYRNLSKTFRRGVSLRKLSARQLLQQLIMNVWFSLDVSASQVIQGLGFEVLGRFLV